MHLRLWTCVTLLCGHAVAQIETSPPPAIHYVIERRGGAFAPNWTANLPYLMEQLKRAESRFNFTRREVRSNKIVRVPKERAIGGGEVAKLIGEFGHNGTWYARMRIGTPPQKVHLDIDMLTRDFYVTTTSSSIGSRFEDFFSSTYAENQFKIRPFPNCGFPADNILLPTVNRTHGLSFAHCKPRRQSRDTLLSSGSLFGLALSSSLSQLTDNLPTFIGQLKDAGFIKEEVFSLTLISGEQGILSLGGTIQDAVAQVESRIESHLGRPQSSLSQQGPTVGANEAANSMPGAFGAEPPHPPGAGLAPPKAAPFPGPADGAAVPPAAPAPAPMFGAAPAAAPPAGAPPTFGKRDLSSMEEVHMFEKRQDDGNAQKVPTFEDLNPFNRAGRMKQHGQHQPSWKDGWKWSPVEGAAGWWQILMRGIWADQVKIMKNQPCIVDINTPFILAPPLAAKAFYAAISGSYRLPAPYSNFYAYPCNNPPYLHFEFGGWRFPVMRGTKSSTEHRGANGKFSLGKVSDDSGYCVGAVVETRMGVGDASPVKKASNSRESFGSGFESGMLAGNGLRDVWILGEPVFRGMGLVFDMKTKEVGFRTY